MMDIFCVLSQATGVTEQALREAVLRSASHNDGADLSRVQRVLRKAACGETITVAGLGGSITQGVAAKSYGNGRGNNAREFSDALGGEKCWLDRTADSLRLRYPASQVTSVNAGIGATPSFLGTFRMDRMVLQHKPDLVFVEFSVNDPSTHAFLLENEIFDAYESIVRKLLEADVAVVLVFLNDRDNNGLQRIHSKIAHHYGVPAVSYHDAVYPEGKLICDWIKLSPDEIHPNNVGHTLLAACVEHFFETALAAPEMEPYPIPESWLYRDTFHKVYATYADEFRDNATGALEFHTDTPDCFKWFGTLVSSGMGQVTIPIPAGAKRIWVQYHHDTGAFETELDSQQTVCNTAPIGWPRVMWHRVYTGAAISAERTLTIRTHKAGQTVILGVLVAF